MSEKKLWSRSETLQLIENFEQNRGLWDPTLGRNSGYLKKIKKHTLQKLAVEFNTSDLEVGRKLHNLKTQFSQELKKEQQHTSSGEVYKSKWQYFDLMKFLQPTVNQNSSSATDDSMVTFRSNVSQKLCEAYKLHSYASYLMYLCKVKFQKGQIKKVLFQFKPNRSESD